jgi:MFS family permease
VSKGTYLQDQNSTENRKKGQPPLRYRPPILRYRPKFFYGWIVLFTAVWSAFFTGPGQTYSYSIFIDSFIQEFAWSRTLVSLLYTMATLISGFLMSLIGRMVDRFGARRVCIGAGLLLAFACLWSSFVMNPMMLFAGFFLGRFSGQGSLSLSADTLAPRWFIKRRALAIMLTSVGYALSNAVYPLLNNYLVNTFGWRNAFRGLAVSLWVLYIPVAFLFMVSSPEDMGLNPDGRTGNEDNPDVPVKDDEYSFTQGQAVRTWVFWGLSYCIFQLSLVGTGLTFHFISIMAERGYSSSFAARVLSVKPLVGFAATVLVGLFLDRLKRPQFVLTAALAAQCASSVMLVFLSGTPMAYAFAVFAGVSEAVIILSVTVLRPFLFGRKYIGSVSGAMWVIVIVGSALGPLPIGAVYDILNGYREIVMITALLPAVGIVLSLLIRKPAVPKDDSPAVD